MLVVSLSIVLFTLGILTTDFNNFKESYAQIGHGHELPQSLIGDREVFLNFNKTELKSVTEKNIIDLALIDNKTGNSVPHITFIVSIYDQDNKNNFAKTFTGMME